MNNDIQAILRAIVDAVQQPRSNALPITDRRIVELEAANRAALDAGAAGQTTLPLKASNSTLHEANASDQGGYGRYVNQSIVEPVRRFKLISTKSCT